MTACEINYDTWDSKVAFPRDMFGLLKRFSLFAIVLPLDLRPGGDVECSDVFLLKLVVYVDFGPMTRDVGPRILRPIILVSPFHTCFDILKVLMSINQTSFLYLRSLVN